MKLSEEVINLCLLVFEQFAEIAADKREESNRVMIALGSLLSVFYNFAIHLNQESPTCRNWAADAVDEGMKHHLYMYGI